jgi:hypothetical protein
MKPLRLALLISVCAARGASAQSAAQRDAHTPATWEDFLSHDAPATVIVIDEAGIEARGRLVLLTADDLTIAVADGRDQTFLRSRVAAVFQPGDSVKNGAAIGFLAGAAMGLGAHNEVGCWNAQLTVSRECTATEKAGFATGVSLLLGGVGAGIGALLDKIIPGRRLLYERPGRPLTTISMKPSLTRSRVALSMGMSW